MLRACDLSAYIDLYRGVKLTPSECACDSPGAALDAQGEEGAICASDLWRLRRSLRIASAAGDVDEAAVLTLDAIVGSLSKHGGRYKPLTASLEWRGAIAWALDHPDRHDGVLRPYRQDYVGAAVQRLRSDGYEVEINSYGPSLEDSTLARIEEKIDFAVSEFGGLQFASTICAHMRACSRIHDGMWLFGTQVPGVRTVGEPAIPIGWLFPMALRHLHHAASTTPPDLSSTLQLAIDVAATMDCQRYNQFDDLHLQPGDFLRVLEESLKWRELFCLPQVPPTVLSVLREALKTIAWPSGTHGLRLDTGRLLSELEALLVRSASDNITIFPSPYIRRCYPHLWRFACAKPGTVNTDFGGVFSAKERTHERTVLFQVPEGEVAVLPIPIAAAAGCEVVFRLIWSTLRKKADHFVGRIMEKSIEIACRGKPEQVFADVSYNSIEKGKRLQIDLAARHEKSLTIFETKAKSLTSQSRSMDMLSFLQDYSRSFLTLLKQLVRHHRNIVAGKTPMTKEDEALADIRVNLFAVSPLTYGPCSDNLLSSTLVHAISGSELTAVEHSAEVEAAVDVFNEALGGVWQELQEMHEGESEIDVTRYMFHVRWCDLGELVYLQKRAKSVDDGFRALRHLTFVTRDFWSEIAFADRQGLTKEGLHPPRGGWSQ